jgi:acyl carrier protein
MLDSEIGQRHGANRLGAGGMTRPEDVVLGVVARAVKEDIELDSGMRLAEELGISSLAMVVIITELADLFGIDIFEFADADLLTLQTVGDVVTFFTGRQRANQAAAADDRVPPVAPDLSGRARRGAA